VPLARLEAEALHRGFTGEPFIDDVFVTRLP
jgi:hypothetical protein